MRFMRRKKTEEAQKRLDKADRLKSRSEEILQRVERLQDEDTVISLRAERGRLRRFPSR